MMIIDDHDNGDYNKSIVKIKNSYINDSHDDDDDDDDDDDNDVAVIMQDR